MANEGGVLNPAPGTSNFTANLVPGNNLIIVIGTNDNAQACSDTVTVIRAIAPFVNFTNANVAGGTTNYSVSMPVVTPWSVVVTNLVAGKTNFVTMHVTNGVLYTNIVQTITGGAYALRSGTGMWTCVKPY